MKTEQTGPTRLPAEGAASHLTNSNVARVSKPAGSNAPDQGARPSLVEFVEAFLSKPIPHHQRVVLDFLERHPNASLSIDTSRAAMKRERARLSMLTFEEFLEY